MNSSNNKRIARNTMLLYVRMLLTMAVSLYTSRVVLRVLGVDDYGIYSVVGGFVAMLGFLNNAMASGTQRFLTYELGNKDALRLSRVFIMSLNIHILIGVVLLVLAATVGVWVLNTKLVIPADRLNAANWVLCFSVLSFWAGVVTVPYNAAIIAHERMAVFAWLSIVEVVLKLGVVFILQWFGYDKLKLFATLTFVATLLVRLLYAWYCHKRFEEAKLRWYWDKSLFGSLLAYAGWNLWGNAASVLSSQGVNVLLNLFFGPAINAARGIADQIRLAINGFVTNFQVAVNPQIIKSYAKNDLAYMHQLITQAAKLSFFLLFLVSLPVLLEPAFVLNLWLEVVPDYAVVFSRLVVVNVLIDSLSGPLMTAAHSSGKIARYQVLVGGLLLLVVPLSYLLLYWGYQPEVVYWVSIAVSCLALFVRLFIISPLVRLPISLFLHRVLLPVFPVVLLSLCPAIFFQQFFASEGWKFIFTNLIALSSALLAIYFVALKSEEKQFVAAYVRKRLKRTKQN